MKIMRDQTHNEQLEKWANFVKNNPIESWKKQLTPFLDSQILISGRFYKELAKTKKGREKIEKLRKLKTNACNK